MTDHNLIIAKPEELKTLMFQWPDEYKRQELNDDRHQLKSKPLSRAELANYYGMTKSTVNIWVKKDLLSHTIRHHQLLCK